MEVVAAAHMPPSVCVLVLKLELSEGEDGVLEGGCAERGTLQVTILDVDVVVVLWVALTADHRENKHVLLVDGGIGDFEPKLDGVFSRPLLERRSVKANVAFW